MEIRSILIADTTREERERIVAESIGNVDGSCDGCMAGLIDMYQDYIDGKKEIKEINMDFKAHYESGEEGPEKTGCSFV
ncbi:MAG: purine biosynthesis protein PurH [Lachnospiraceae bacterium]|nr:purine biosynthesis protein PurH [Lachnospiraceae bacterium]